MPRGETSGGKAAREATKATACLLCLSKWADFTICYAPVAAWFGTQLAGAGYWLCTGLCHQVVLGLPIRAAMGGETYGFTQD
jgi:hypothetical protein